MACPLKSGRLSSRSPAKGQSTLAQYIEHRACHRDRNATGRGFSPRSQAGSSALAGFPTGRRSSPDRRAQPRGGPLRACNTLRLACPLPRECPIDALGQGSARPRGRRPVRTGRFSDRAAAEPGLTSKSVWRAFAIRLNTLRLACPTPQGVLDRPAWAKARPGCGGPALQDWQVSRHGRRASLDMTSKSG